MTAEIPNRAVFRAQEVCDIAGVQPYVLRSWEAEFPDLGVAKSAAAPRIYRRADVELVLRLKQLVFVDGLTLAGARKRLGDEGRVATPEPVVDADVAALMDDEARQQLREVRRGLQWILGVLDGAGITPEDRVLRASPPAARASMKKAAASSSAKHHPAAQRKKPAHGRRK